MAEHLFLPDRFKETTAYRGKGRGGGWAPPTRSREAHGNFLLNRLKNLWAEVDRLGETRQAMLLPHPQGARITFRLFKDSAQQIKKLEHLRDNPELAKVRLRHAYQTVANGQECLVAVVWVPNAKRGFYLDKLREYLNETTLGGKPKNNDLVSCIEDIYRTLLDDFWPSHEQSRIPTDGTPDWVEVWLANDRTDELNKEALDSFNAACHRLDIQIAQGRQLEFPERRVVLVKADRQQLQELIECCAEVAELRLARACVTDFTRDAAIGDWLRDLAERVIPPGVDSPAVCILDTGINRGHVLLSLVCQASDCLTVENDWGIHDHHKRGHGTAMSGLAAYGPLEVALGSAAPVELTHWIESVKLHGPSGHAKTLAKDLWGQFTERAAAVIEAAQPIRARIFCMAITSTEDMDRGMPSSWSGAIDQLTSGYLDDDQRLFIVSAGNVCGDENLLAYPDSNETAGIQDPAQAWNALTVGAFTDKVVFDDPKGGFLDHTPLAEQGDLSPHSTTALVDWDKSWPIKPEIVCEGGNLLKTPDGKVTGHDDLDTLTTSHSQITRSVVPFSGTSAATAHAAWMAGQVQAAYPAAWPETIRALLVHSARWTDAMLKNRLPNHSKESYRQLVQTVGYGVPDLGRALACGGNSLTLVAEQTIQPYERKPGGGDRTREMHLHRLPWPRDVLQSLPPETLVTVRVTLSYFVEPSPQEIGWKDRYRYASHGLRWDMKRAEEDDRAFMGRITTAMAQEEESEDSTASQASSDNRWCIGSNTRSRGSLHADVWENATAAEVAACNLIVVYPTIGWWRTRKQLGRLEREARYSLIISIDSPDQSVDIYTPVAAHVGIAIAPATITTTTT